MTRYNNVTTSPVSKGNRQFTTGSDREFPFEDHENLLRRVGKSFLKCSVNATATQQEYSGKPPGIPQEYCGNAEGILQENSGPLEEYCRNIVGLLQECSRNATGTL